MDVVTFMLHNFGLSNSYGDEALFTKNYFQNKIPTKALDDTKIHIDLWIGAKPKLNSFENVQMYFSIVQKEGKNQSFIQLNIYIYLAIMKKKSLQIFTKIVKQFTIIISRDVVFEEMNCGLEYEQNETNLNELLFNTFFK